MMSGETGFRAPVTSVSEIAPWNSSVRVCVQIWIASRSACRLFASTLSPARTLTVSASNTVGSEVESLPIGLTPLVEGDEGCWGPGDLGKTDDVQFNINLDWMIQLVEATKHPRDVILGVAQVASSKQCLFRVIEDYVIDESGKYVETPAEGQKGYACRALRFVPSKQ